tara:strand:+ start:2597 stop:3745 length:1149 start_codon:yes stop_codon:yes gene_type:complete
MYKKVNLVKDTIDKSDIDELISWLSTNPRLTKDKETILFEREWSQWQNRNSSIFVNSGSSANFLMFHALLYSGMLKNKKVVVPSISWVTTVSPAILLGYDPIICDCDDKNLGLSVQDFEKICKKEKPAVAIIVHVLGHSNNMNEILKICKKYGVILLEDCCEAYGTIYNGKKVGNFGLMSSFSFYFGHHMSTIEGGMVSTDNNDLKNILASIRSHGWTRDMDEDVKRKHLNDNNISDFDSLFTFIYPGMNLRSTDLSAFIGRKQLKKLDSNVKNRNHNYQKYKKKLDGQIWVQKSNSEVVSSLGLGIISESRERIVSNLIRNNIECRPLICGCIQEQPFWNIKKRKVPNALNVHNNGFYVPCHDKLSDDDINFVCTIVVGSI